MCFSGVCETPRTIPFLLRVAAAGSGFTGDFELHGTTAVDVVMDVTGVMRPDGYVLFTGTRAAIPDDLVRTDLRELLVRTDPLTGLTGHIDLHQAAPQDATLTGDVTSASFEPFDAASPQMSGTWSGEAILRACSGFCPSYRNQTLGISLALGQSGTDLSGQVQLSIFEPGDDWLSIHGAASGNSLSLSSNRIVLTSNAGDRARLLAALTGTIDTLGRIAGGFTYAADGRIAIEPFNVSYRLQCEILWLTRNP